MGHNDAEKNRKKPPAAKRLKKMTSFIVMDVLEKAQEMERRGMDVIHLEVGEPDFDTPECIRAAACSALDRGFTRYTHSLGMTELRRAICEHYKKTCNVSFGPERVIVTSGTSPAMFLAFASLLEPDDEVILSDPHYACYPNFISFFNARPVFVPVTEDKGFQFSPRAVSEKLHRKTRAILINSPSNPTGAILSADVTEKIAGMGPYILSDEIYHGLEYGDRARSILEFTDHAFVFNGFSKLYAMTGMRLGYVIAPENFIRPMQKLQQNFFISANAAVQKAGIAALRHADKDVKKMVATYDKRRKYMIARLRGMGFVIKAEPAGAFYVFVNASHIRADSYGLAFEILEKAGVGVTPGIDFGKNGEGYLRLSYANSMERIKTGLDRIEAYLKKLSISTP